MSVPVQQENRIPAAKFKAKCLELIDDAYGKHQDVVVTKRGVPMARLVPYQLPEKSFRSIFGRSPAVQPPGKGEWKSAKDESAKAWDESAKRLARQMNGDFREKR